jgi:decaprenylphospho-beta-D-erythro-pentofuranosid-2-ulose 2-reductase
MENAFGQPQTIVVLGGTSDIARAVVERLCRARARTVVLAGRNQAALAEAAGAATAAGATTTATVLFDATNADGAEQCVAECFAAAGGPVDLVVMAVGYLGNQRVDEDDATAAAKVATINFAWPVAALTGVRHRMVAQGSGRILVMSSVTALRVRRGAYLYAGAKAGLDRLCDAMADSLIDTGVTLQLLRPGFVHTKMTTGRTPAPFAVTADRVADDAVAGLATSKRVITSPPIAGYLLQVLRHLPRALWRKVSARTED